MMTNGRFKRAATVFLTLALLLSISITSVNAASYCKSISGSSNGASVTFNITTGKGWISGQNVTLTQAKGTIHYLSWTVFGNKYRDEDVWGIYYITVRNAKTGKVYNGYNNKRWDGKNFKIKLGKNTAYQITVTPAKLNTYKLKHMEPVFTKRSWKKASKWEIKSTRNVSLCYINAFK